MSTGPGSPIRRTSLVDEIVGRLQREIVDGRLAPGQALPSERELAEKYGVTRASLKQALVRIEEVGLIRTRHGVGSIVQDVQQDGGADLLKYLAPPDGSRDFLFLREILEARCFIGGAIARLAARRRTRKHLAELEQALQELERRRDDPKETQRLENVFVRALGRACGNKVFNFVTNSVSAAYKLDLATYAAPFRDGAWVAAQLRTIQEAVGDGDEAAAGAATEAYFDECGRRVLAQARAGARR
ncbi:MAG TPA: FCD domain-containing protein [Myxococcota bacterium]|jgi:DNA-binding FadR family transcriptional regulator|nr:FCD domain-containing protein [Myxococcota bacterium]